MKPICSLALLALAVGRTLAGVGDPQAATDHVWYPGELACSSFERLERTQAKLYEFVVGERPTTDAQRVLAAWLWRNTHYWHGEQGVEDLWGKGFSNDADTATREYWTGLFAHGFGLCGTTHAQWTAEMQHLLGHNRARVVGVSGHNSFEVFLTGEAYGSGRWALLDHDVSTVIFDDQGKRLLSIAEIKEKLQHWTREQVAADKQHGWLVSGLHPDDGSAFDTYTTAEYFAGYAGPPPLVHLRRGESLRRYLNPGLEDGKTFVFWGRNYNTQGIPGPERSRTWVNQPQRMHGSQQGSGYRPGQARYANAVFQYAPDFANDDYREGVVDESDQHVTFEFQSSYIIAATPANADAWGIYQAGCRNGLVVQGDARVPISLSTDRGQSWQAAGTLDGRLDLTDWAKGHRQYWLRLEASARELANRNLLITTVCQANAAVIPRLKDGRTRVEFQASGRSLVSAGPNRAQAESHRIAGAFDSSRVTLELAAPRSSASVAIHAAAHVASSNPPSPDVAYRIDYSLDRGQTWQPLVDDWRITRQGQEPADFWSQSFCWGSSELSETRAPVQVRFENSAGKRYRRAEVHLAYRLPNTDATRVSFQWRDDQGLHLASHEFESDTATSSETAWMLPTGNDVETLWVEYQPAIR